MVGLAKRERAKTVRAASRGPEARARVEGKKDFMTKGYPQAGVRCGRTRFCELFPRAFFSHAALPEGLKIRLFSVHKERWVNRHERVNPYKQGWSFWLLRRWLVNRNTCLFSCAHSYIPQSIQLARFVGYWNIKESHGQFTLFPCLKVESSLSPYMSRGVARGLIFCRIPLARCSNLLKTG